MICSGTIAWLRKVLEMSVRTSVNWSAQALVALCGLTLGSPMNLLINPVTESLYTLMSACWAVVAGSLRRGDCTPP